MISRSTGLLFEFADWECFAAEISIHLECRDVFENGVRIENNHVCNCYVISGKNGVNLRMYEGEDDLDKSWEVLQTLDSTTMATMGK